MLTEIYIEALLVEEELADQVWEAWNTGEINDLGVCWLWIGLAASVSGQAEGPTELQHPKPLKDSVLLCYLCVT